MLSRYLENVYSLVLVLRPSASALPTRADHRAIVEAISAEDANCAEAVARWRRRRLLEDILNAAHPDAPEAPPP